MRDYFESETRTKSWTGGLIPNKVQVHRWYWMKDNILNPIRMHVKSPVIITSCLRNQESYDRLLARGYHPSQKSDHFSGTPIALTKPEDISRFGRFYTYSTFACDIAGAFDHKKLCRDILLTVTGRVSNTDPSFIAELSGYGVEQVILESQILNGKRIFWVHVSAPLEAFYSKSEAAVIRHIRKKFRFLEFKDGAYMRSSFK